MRYNIRPNNIELDLTQTASILIYMKLQDVPLW